MITRGLKGYTRLLGQAFVQIVRQGKEDPGFSWMEAGPGAGIAGLHSVFFDPEASIARFLRPTSAETLEKRLLPKNARIRNLTFVGVENILYELTLHPNFDEIWTEKNLMETKLTRGDKWLRKKLIIARIAASHPDVIIRNLHGMPILERPLSDFEEYDFITDVLGPFPYSERKLETLYLYWKTLKPGGTALVLSPGDKGTVNFTCEGPRANAWQINEWIKRLHLPDLTASTEDQIITITKTKNGKTHPELEQLIQETLWIPQETKMTYPPTFSYRTSLPPPPR